MFFGDFCFMAVSGSTPNHSCLQAHHNSVDEKRRINNSYTQKEKVTNPCRSISRSVPKLTTGKRVS